MEGKGEMQDYLSEKGERGAQLAFLVWDLVCILSSFSGERKGHSSVKGKSPVFLVSSVVDEPCTGCCSVVSDVFYSYVRWFDWLNFLLFLMTFNELGFLSRISSKKRTSLNP